MLPSIAREIALHNTVVAYCIYLPIMIGLTIWVARTIHKNTRPFLLEIFPNHENVALAVNNLLQMGFYLISLGYGFLKLRIQYSSSWFSSEENLANEFMLTNKDVVEELAIKLGGFTLFIGFILFFNLFLMLILRKGSRTNKQANPQFQQYAQHISGQGGHTM
jgi:hypothetical protein